jgi:REP element-mobilizing transposase RayT
MIIAHHLVWTPYGWWLPNDPRGSMSHFIQSDVLAQLGELHYGRKKVQPASAEIRSFYQRAEGLLKHDLLLFSPPEVQVLAGCFTQAMQKNRYTCYACAIMPDHVHVLIRKHRDAAERMIANLQEDSRVHFRKLLLRPQDHPVWGGHGWKVYLDHPDEVRRTIRYIRENPRKQRLPDQAWGFVTEYDGWPLHPGHSPYSPYARRKHGEAY